MSDRSGPSDATLFSGSELRRAALPEQVARQIIQMIVAGKLQPGQRLPNERELAASFDVGRLTVREALRGLQMMNILHVRQGGATQVTDLAPEALIEPFELMCSMGTLHMESIMEVRASLEAGVARYAALRISEEEFRTIEAAVRDTSGNLEDPQAWHEADLNFHALLVDAARNPMFGSLMAALARLSRASRAMTAQVREVRVGAAAEHLEIVEALRQRAPEVAAEAMMRHMTGVLERYRAHRLASERIEPSPPG